ncbi:glycine cleavage system protein R [Nitrincola sp. MINF-07-Sa-05]|uniref:glycine cleavage system protein R n=1 Tax=Nitrincola salilacus TaxID=3400273 RepID=UPI0039184F7B
MMTSLVLTVIGPDRPGLVEALSRTIAEHQGNWLESGMSRLAGKFAGIMVAQVPADQSQALITALQALASKGLKVTVEAGEEVSSEIPRRAISLALIGHDRPGIVKEISQALAARHVNVERLTTLLVSGSMSGEQLFQADAQLSVPDGLDLDELQEALESLANDLMVDISLR